jgi:hypothetical protein
MGQGLLVPGIPREQSAAQTLHAYTDDWSTGGDGFLRDSIAEKGYPDLVLCLAERKRSMADWRLSEMLGRVYLRGIMVGV